MEYKEILDSARTCIDAANLQAKNLSLIHI